MLNAPLPLVSMSWSRLLLLILVLSFVLSSLISILFRDELGDPFTSEHHQSLHIAHSQLVQPQEATKKPQTVVSVEHDAANGTAVDEESGIRLSSIVFGGLAAEEAEIEAMEKAVREARAEQQKTLPQPTSPYTSRPLVLANLTTEPFVHLALIPAPSAAASAVPPPSFCELSADAAVFSLIVVTINESIVSSLEQPALIGEDAAHLRRYTRTAASFFLASPSSLRHIVTDDWQLQSSLPIPLAGELLLSAATPDHTWTAVAYKTLELGTHEYTLHIDISQLLSNPPSPARASFTLPGHQEVTALTFLSFNSSSARLLLSRRADVRRFRAYEIELSMPTTVGAESTASHLLVRELDEGARSSSVGSGIVIELLHYQERPQNSSRDSVVVIEYDPRGDSISPFNAALYSAPSSDTDCCDGSHDKQLRVLNETDDSNRSELVQVIDEATQHTLVPANTTNTTGAAAHNDTHNHTALDQLPSSTQLLYPDPKTLWTLAANPFPRYRAIHSLWPLPPAALIHSSSPSHSFVSFASTPFLTTVDHHRHFEPIEIIHLHPNTVFTHMAVNQHATLIALIDRQRDVILLERKQPPPVTAEAASGRGGKSGGGEGKTQWEVALELLLPPMLKRLDVLSAAIVCVNRSTQTADATQSSPSRPTSTAAPSPPSTSLSSVSAATDRTYLAVLFTSGVLATFDLDVDDRDWSGGGGLGDELGGGGVLGLLGVTVLGDAIALNWEFLIGLAVIVFSAVFSLQMQTISRAFQQTAAR